MSPVDERGVGGNRELMLTRIIDAPREKVYRAWTEPGLLKQWFAPLPWTTPRAETDVRPGGVQPDRDAGPGRPGVPEPRGLP